MKLVNLEHDEFDYQSINFSIVAMMLWNPFFFYFVVAKIAHQEGNSGEYFHLSLQFIIQQE